MIHLVNACAGIRDSLPQGTVGFRIAPRFSDGVVFDVGVRLEIGISEEPEVLCWRVERFGLRPGFARLFFWWCFDFFLDLKMKI